MGLHRIVNQRRQHLRQGERFRWWKAIKVPTGTAGVSSDGVKLIEQEIPAVVRVLIFNTVVDKIDKSFGPIPAGTMEVSAIPKWGDFFLRLNHNDRFMPLGIGRSHTERSNITRAASGTTDIFPYTPIRSITAIYIAGVLQDAANYEATETGINWLDNIPTAGTKYVAEYEYYPRYVVIPQRFRTSPTDRNGNSLPLHYWLDLEGNTRDKTY